MKPNHGSTVVTQGLVRDLTRDGDGIVDTDQGIRFVQGALPNELVEFGIDAKSKGKQQRATLVEVITPSPDRVSPTCHYSQACGGCPWMHFSVSAQRKRKAINLSHMLDRLSVTNLEIDLRAGVHEVGYRQRARLAWFRDTKTLVMGYRQRGGTRVMPIPGCIVLEKPLQNAWHQLWQTLKAHLQDTGEISLYLSANDLPAAALQSPAVQPSAVFDALAELVENKMLSGATALFAGASKPALWGDPRTALSKHHGVQLWGPPDGFGQANREVNELMTQTVKQLADSQNKTVVELYAGSGNLTASLAQGATSVLAIEFDKTAAAMGMENMSALGLAHVKFVHADVGLAKLPKRADVVVLDPPRTGAKEVIDRIIAMRPERVVYVSCDVATLERDLRGLISAGYAITHACMADMFPQTGHQESVVGLQKR